MTLGNPDPLNLQGDELYSIYRKGIITRHITGNGKFLDHIALESIDDLREVTSRVNVVHSAFYRDNDGRRGPNVTIKIPTKNARYSEEIDPNGPIIGGKYTVKPHLWVPLIAPIKYPGITEHEEIRLRKGPSPWFPQAYHRKRFHIPKMYYVPCSNRGDNAGYYGGMACAAFALESLHGVSPHSILHARHIIQGFLAMEMNGRNGYMIRYRGWHVKPLDVKLIRGHSNEELLGILLGIMFYLKAEEREDPNHPLYQLAFDLRDRILYSVSRGNITDSYKHPFMDEYYHVKNYEYAFNASKGEEQGSKTYYFESALLGVTFPGVDARIFEIKEKHLENLAMTLYSMILVLTGDLPDEKKVVNAIDFITIIKGAIIKNRSELKENAFLAVVALLVNKYLNSDRNCFLISGMLVGLWTSSSSGVLDISIWDEFKQTANNLIYFCKSLDNEDVAFREEFRDHWQHNLPFYTAIPEDDEIVDETVMRMRNPHQRIGAFFEWKSKYPHWWHNKVWKFADYIGWPDAGFSGMDEQEYLQTDEKRYRTLRRKHGQSDGYVEKEISQFRGHHDTQIEGAAMSLIFLRMLLTHISPTAYPPPQIPDKNVLYPVLPFPGFEPLDPKFLHYEYHKKSTEGEGWKIYGDKDKALQVIAFPDKNLVITASAGEDDKLWLDSWVLTDDEFLYIDGRESWTYDQVVLRKTSSTESSDILDILIVAERSEDKKSFARDKHYLWISMYKVLANGGLSLLAEIQGSGRSADSIQELDMCILNFKWVGVTFKTLHDKALVKIFELDFANNLITERTDFEAEYGSDEEHREIEDTVWIGSAWDDILINGYKVKENPFHTFWLFSRSIYSLDKTYTMVTGASKGEPIGAVTVKRGGKYYVVTAGYREITQSGYTYSNFELCSFEVSRYGQLLFNYSAIFEGEPWDSKYLLRNHPPTFERMSISRAQFGKEGDFVIAGKDKIGSGKGMVILYGGLTEEGKPTLWDWNCMGSGDNDSIKMIDLCGSARLGIHRGAVTAYKGKNDELILAWWRYGEHFRLGDRLRSPSPHTGSDRLAENNFTFDGND